MKRSRKKLTLHRETLRPLVDAVARGGNAIATLNCTLVCPTWAAQGACPSTPYSECCPTYNCVTVVVPNSEP